MGLYSALMVERVLLATLACYIIADCSGAEGLILGPAWCFYALFGLHTKALRALSITIILGAATFITDIIFLAAQPRPSAAVVFAVCV